jgi:4-amino-4-deoxy-L-arabinose transferase-like glycosyltransferase
MVASRFTAKQRAPVILPAFIVLIGLGLRLILLGSDVRFHPDEALFAAQARLISQQGDVLLRTTDLDKPPLTFYVTALSFRVWGPTEFAARLPNVLISGLGVAVLWALAWACYRDRTVAATAALMIALCPYDLAFAATTFTDVQATFWVLVASLCAACDRWRGAGITAALAFAAKSNALLFLPLILVVGMTNHLSSEWRWRDVARRLWAFALPLLIGIALLLLWDAARSPRSFWDLGYARNNPGRLIRSDEVGPRLQDWTHWLSMITGSAALTTLLIGIIILWLVWRLWRGRSRWTAIDLQIAGFGLGFLAWHWLIAFNTYDRYLHTLIPLVLLLAARAGVGFWNLAGINRRPLVVLLAGILMLPSALITLRGQAGIGGDQGRHQGIDTLANYLNNELSGQIVYDHWLGWELAYYLGSSPNVIVLYSPLPEALAADMAEQPAPRYFVAPSAAQAAPWLNALHRADILESINYSDPAHRFVVYRLVALDLDSPHPARQP